MKKYKSHAVWPVEAKVPDNHSKDGHDTYEAAYAVCKALRKQGFGGEGKIFPTGTWVEGPIEINNEREI